ncbi:MAG: hypothetical protein WA850_13960 [Xanthobacteraceae bacterium]
MGGIGRLRFSTGLLGDLGRALQLARLLVANGDVAHDPGEASLIIDIAPFRNGEIEWDNGSILAAPGHLAADSNDLAFPGSAISDQTIVVHTPIGFHHQRTDVPSDGLFGRVTEDRLRRPIEGLDNPESVGDDDRIDPGVEDRKIAVGALAQDPVVPLRCCVRPASPRISARQPRGTIPKPTNGDHKLRREPVHMAPPLVCQRRRYRRNLGTCAAANDSV